MALGLRNLVERLRALIEGRPYYYEERNVKRWVAESEACELCIDAEDEGWILDDNVWESEQFGFIDSPPMHTNCRCEIEYGVKRKRVYL